VAEAGGEIDDIKKSAATLQMREIHKEDSAQMAPHNGPGRDCTN